MSDVAATQVRIEAEKLDVKAIPLSMFLTEERIASAREKSAGVGEGDEAVLIRFVHLSSGRFCSEPVVRFGHIARMPYDPVPIKMDPAENAAFVPVRAYLAEAASWGGQSGSPAFVFFAPDRVPGTISVGGPTSGFALLGLVHGHYPYRQKIKITSGDVSGEGRVDFNLGLSVLITAQDIVTVLNSEVYMERRQKAAEDHRRRMRPRLMSLTSRPLSKRYLSSTAARA